MWAVHVAGPFLLASRGCWSCGLGAGWKSVETRSSHHPTPKRPLRFGCPCYGTGASVDVKSENVTGPAHSNARSRAQVKAPPSHWRTWRQLCLSSRQRQFLTLIPIESNCSNWPSCYCPVFDKQAAFVRYLFPMIKLCHHIRCLSPIFEPKVHRWLLINIYK